MKDKSTLWWGCIGVLVLAGLCLLVFSIYYFSQRVRAFSSHPLVLIHNPVNHDRVQTGDELVVHATARDDVGIQRMELWVDDQLIAAQDAPAEYFHGEHDTVEIVFPELRWDACRYGARCFIEGSRWSGDSDVRCYRALDRPGNGHRSGGGDS